MNIDKIISELENLKNKVYPETKKIVEKEKEKILDYIREKQLFEKGIDGKGELLKEYKPFTVAYKIIKQQPTNRTTLFDSGSFYRGFDLRFTDQSAIGVFSRDSKTPKLVENYGFSIFEFTEENRKEIDIQIVEKKLEEWLSKQIQSIYTKI